MQLQHYGNIKKVSTKLEKHSEVHRGKMTRRLELMDEPNMTKP